MSATSERLARKLAPLLSEMIGQTVEAGGINIIPARGYWTHTHQDVMGFQGSIHPKDGGLYLMGSWNNMTDCLRYGFEIHDGRGKYRAEAHFMLEAKNVRRPRI